MWDFWKVGSTVGASHSPLGGRNPFDEFMRKAAPGDLVFTFGDTKILAIGVVQSYCRESPQAVG
jgi:hypothetical protein